MRSRKKKSLWKQMDNSPKLMGHNKGSLEKEVHSNSDLPKKHRNISNKQPNPTSTRTRRTKTKCRASRRKEIIKIRTEFNDIETKIRIQRISNYRSWFFEKKLTSL